MSHGRCPVNTPPLSSPRGCPGLSSDSVCVRACMCVECVLNMNGYEVMVFFTLVVSCLLFSLSPGLFNSSGSFIFI